MIRGLLEDWGMPEEIISAFIEQEIDEIALRNINKEAIDLLIPKLGLRIKFCLKWKAWLSNNVSSDLYIEQEEEQFMTYNVEKEIAQNEANDVEKVTLDLPVINATHFMKTISSTFAKNFETTSTSSTMEISPTTDSIMETTPSTSSTMKTTSSTSSSMENVDVTSNIPITKDNLQIIPRINDSENYNLKEILSESTRGKEVLSYFKRNGELTDRLRNYIADCILCAELATDADKKITVSRMTFLAEKITELFPTEQMIIWIQKCKKFNGSTVTKGKLLHRYYNIRRCMIKAGLISISKSKYLDSVDENILEQEYSQDIKDQIEWLKHNIEPWSRVIHSWQVTSKARLEQLKLQDKGKKKRTCNIHNYMTQYSVLTTLSGYSLLEIDFDTLYPTSVIKFYGEWPKLFNFILKKLQNDSTVSQEKFLIENDAAQVLMLLSRLFPVHTVIKHKGTGQWRPSRQEILEGFILHVKIPGDIELALHKKREKLKSFGLTLQPQIIIVGPTSKDIHQNFIVIDNILYEVESTLKAVDITFKSFHALHAIYPIESERIWLFLQQAVYNIQTPWDKQDSSVTILVEEFRAF